MQHLSQKFGTPLTAGFEIPTGTFDIILDQFRKKQDLYQIIFGDFFLAPPGALIPIDHPNHPSYLPPRQLATLTHAVVRQLLRQHWQL